MREVLKKFIVFEGIDGAGTTTQTELLYNFLTKQGYSVLKTFEPTDGFIGKTIRELLSCDSVKKVENRTLLYLYLADRYEHIYSAQGIVKLFSDYDFIISDRYFFSTIAYQGVNDNIDEIKNLCSVFPYPEVVFYIDIPVDVSLNRIEKRGGKKDIFEKKSFLDSTLRNYQDAFSPIPSSAHYFSLDGVLSSNTIAKNIVEHLYKIYGIQ